MIADQDIRAAVPIEIGETNAAFTGGRVERVEFGVFPGSIKFLEANLHPLVNCQDGAVSDEFGVGKME